MKIKPKYTDPETTPLKFLKFIRVTLWIGLFLTVAEIISQFTSGIDWYMLGINLVGGVLTLAAISGLNRMEWYGVKAYCGSYLLRMMDGLLAVGIYAYSGRIEESGSAVGSILGSGIGLLLVWIYFQKRRLLFTPIPEEYLPLMEKEQELVQEFTQEEKAEPMQPAEPEPIEYEPVGLRSKTEAVLAEENRDCVTVSQPPVEENGKEKLVSRFCWNCGNPLMRKSKFCDLCGKVVYRPEGDEPMAAVRTEKPTPTVVLPKLEPVAEKKVFSAVSEKPHQKRGKSWLGLVLVLLVVGLVAGVLLLSPPQLPTPTQAAENVLYLEVYDSADVCIGTGSGFLVEDQTTLVTNYHVIENASYILVAAQDGELAAEVDTVLAYDVELDLAVLQCSQQVNAQPLTLGDSDLVEQGDKIYAVSYPLGIANTLTDGIVSSKYVDELNVELLQITAPISEGSSGGALLNETGQVVGVVCSYYVDGQNMNIAIAINQLQALLEQKEENAVLLKTIMEGDGKHIRKSRAGFVYCKIPSVLSLENIFEESEEISFIKNLPIQEGQMYSYMTDSKEVRRYYIRKYADLLVENGYLVDRIYDGQYGIYDTFSMVTQDRKYWIYVYDGDTGDRESGYPIFVRITQLTEKEAEMLMGR